MEKEIEEYKDRLNNANVKILVVDDREDNLFSIETILQRDGYKIVKADSGRAALKILLNEQDFSLILMDVQMPKMNGFETASLIYERDKLKHIPIIFITAHEYGEELVFKGYKMGAVDYIYKPVNPELLRFKVGVFVELYQKTNELIKQEQQLVAANLSLKKEVDERKASEAKVKLLNRQLLENNAELKTINEELDRFAYVASHDLQEPLRKILLFSDKISINLAADETKNNVSDYLQKIIDASRRMHVLINDLLRYSKHTRLSDDFKKTDFNEVLVDVLADLEVEIQKRQAVIVAQPLPVLWAIPSQIRQLFQNLISNALKFSKAGLLPHIEILCELQPAASNGKAVNGIAAKDNVYTISVKDNGIGFDTRYAEDIFIAFKRLHSYHEIEGTGIGLSICKKIAEKHNGSITAVSVIDEGSTFIISLPENSQVNV